MKTYHWPNWKSRFCTFLRFASFGITWHKTPVLLWLVIYYDEWRRGIATRKRFKAFCAAKGLCKVNGKWIRETKGEQSK